MPPCAQYTLDEVARHCCWDDCWIVVHDAVYDMTPHVRQHEGWTNGSKQSTLLAILSAMGQDCTDDFDEVHSDRARAQLGAFQIGVLQTANRARRGLRYRSWDELVSAGVVPVGGADAIPHVSLEDLPALLVHLILAVGGCARSADALSCVCRTLHEAVLALGVLPIWPQVDAAASCSTSLVDWDPASGTLHKTQRVGHPLVTFAHRLHARDVLMQLDVTSLPSVGCFQLGLHGYEAKDGCGSSSIFNSWLDGAGRVNSFSTRAREPLPLLQLMGDRLREGDRVGIAYLGSLHAVGYTLGGVLMGAPLLLPAECTHFRFVLRFDNVPDAEVRLVCESNGPIDRAALLASASAFVPRSLPGGVAHGVLVRTIGPDSQCFSIPIDPGVTAVAHLADRVAEVLGCDSGHHIELTFRGDGGRPIRYRPAYMDALHTPDGGGGGGGAVEIGVFEDGAQRSVTLSEVGFETYHVVDGRQLHDVIAGMPFLVS